MTDLLRDELKKRLKAKEFSVYAIARELDLKWDSIKKFTKGGMLRSDHLDDLCRVLRMTLVVDDAAPPVELRTKARKKS